MSILDHFAQTQGYASADALALDEDEQARLELSIAEDFGFDSPQALDVAVDEWFDSEEGVWL